MPPRKRAASAPKEEPEQELLAPETENDEQADATGGPDAREPQDSDDTGAGDESAANAGDGEKPERSDLQTVDQPHEECFPNGWPEGAYSVGCTHGTWVREQN
jgi:hypothetical protein